MINQLVKDFSYTGVQFLYGESYLRTRVPGSRYTRGLELSRDQFQAFTWELGIYASENKQVFILFYKKQVWGLMVWDCSYVLAPIDGLILLGRDVTPAALKKFTAVKKGKKSTLKFMRKNGYL